MGGRGYDPAVMPAPASVDVYLASQPDAQRVALERLRTRIHELVPGAEEAISYGFPAFKVGGKGVVWIAGWKEHCSIYPLTDAFLAAHPDELAGYSVGKGTLRFKPDAPPPDELIDELIRERLADVAGNR
jgi:uncharacterized protein YdhG (YjbR/CyaY superfamily)